MKYVLASSYECFIWQRVLRGAVDPGLVLSYGVRIIGQLKPKTLDTALRILLTRYFPNLLSRFIELNGRLYKRSQGVSAQVLDIIDVSKEFSSVQHHVKEVKIDHYSGPLFKFKLLRLCPDDYLLQLSFSHLVYDGDGYNDLCHYLGQSYNDALNDYQLVEKPTNPVQLESRQKTQQDIEFWKEYLHQRSLVQQLPFLRKNNISVHHFSTRKMKIDGQLFENLCHAAEKAQVSLFQLILGCSAVLLARYLAAYKQQDEIILSHTVSLREQGSPLGCYTNLVPLFISHDPLWTPTDYLIQIKKIRRQVREHQHVAITDIIPFANEKLNRHARILNVVINQSQGLVPHTAPRLSGLDTTLVSYPDTGGPFDLSINFSVGNDGLYLSFDAPAHLASNSLLSEFAAHFEKTLDFFIHHPDEPIASLQLTAPLKPVARGPVCHYQDAETVATTIVKQSREQIEKTAVIFADSRLNYSELADKAVALSHRLYSVLDTESAAGGIGLHLSRTELLPIAMLSAMIINVRFIPLEESLPIKRLSYVIEETNLTVVIVDSHVDATYIVQHHPNVRILVLDEIVSSQSTVNTVSTAGIERFDNPDNTAYVMFTSGSTGAPKGVAISNANLYNFLVSMQTAPGLISEDYMLALTPISFDISILELLLPLFCGATLEIIDNHTRQSAAALASKINNSPVTVIQATPSSWMLLKNVDWHADRVLTLLTGGEAIASDVASYLLAQGHHLYNMYGPTEATIWASCSRIDDVSRICLGIPVNNTEFFVVDSDFQSVPIGVQGQLLIKGECVGQGYLNYDSSAAFIELPSHEGRFYCTGDLVRHLGDGDIEYLGRIDNQVKINGFRIEPEEVTTKIKAIVGDVNVLTVVRTHPDKHLCCFYHTNQVDNIDSEAVLAQLKKALPDYMVPKALIRLVKIPLTPNGKVDIKHLSQTPMMELLTDSSNTTTGAKAKAEKDEDALTQALKQLMFDTLDIEISDLETPFGWFGLNSISYNLLSHRLFERFAVRIAPYQFYAINTLAALGQVIAHSTSEPNDNTSINSVVNTGHQPQARASVASTSTEVSNPHRSDIAIVGIATLMPKGLEAEDFWASLMNKQSLICESTRPSLPRAYHAGFLDNIDQFDEKFFSISPLEAHHMDPRQRLLLQTAWRALEDAGYRRSALAGSKVGCYIAATGMDYATLQAREDHPQSPYSLPGTSLSILSNRLSNFFDWRGPSYTLDTACSGSLIALVKACRDLCFNVCDIALVGGVNIIADAQINQGLEAGNFMSSQHRCATFDAEADGYVRGEGVGCVLIKRYQDAVCDNDAIHALIKSFAENHGGRANSLTAPNPEAQTALLLDAYTPELAKQVSYIETHGTGTKLGDPIEIDALKAAWQQLCASPSHQTVWLGALKSNIGHLEPAAGVASLAKVILALKHQVLPANMHFNQLNPYISLDDSPFEVLTSSREWKVQGPRVAGISSFGFGGVNAHLVVAEASAIQASRTFKSGYLITLSARSVKSLEQMREQLARFLERQLREGRDIGIDRLAYTMNTGREHFEYRLAWVVNSVEHLIELITTTATEQLVIVKPSNVQAKLSLDANSPHYASQLMMWRHSYLRGQELDWELLHQNDSQQRIHLPTYRFDTRSHWFDRTTHDSLR